jgi:hypothetical protein
MKSHLVIALIVFSGTFGFFKYQDHVEARAASAVEEKVIEIEIVVPKVIVKNAIIEMQLADWCSPCKRLKASGAIQELEKQGWTIVYTDGIASKYPSFRVWVDGESKVFTGYSRKSSFFSRIKSIVKDLKD